MTAHHVYPIDDLIKHDTETEHCVCQPRIELVDGGKLVVHNSFDEREIFEEIKEIQ